MVSQVIRSTPGTTDDSSQALAAALDISSSASSALTAIHDNNSNVLKTQNGAVPLTESVAETEQENVLSPFSPKLQKNVGAEGMSSSMSGTIISFEECRPVSVVVQVFAPHDPKVKVCLFPSIEGDADGGAGTGSSPESKSVLDLVKSNSINNRHDLICVNPSAFGKSLPGRVTMETARLVAKVANVESEDWARRYSFDEILWPGQEDGLDRLAKGLADDVLRGIGGGTVLTLGNKKTSSMFGKVSMIKSDANTPTNVNAADLGMIGRVYEELTERQSPPLIALSMLEVYDSDYLKDLFGANSSNRVKLRHDPSNNGIATVRGLSEEPVYSMQQLYRLFRMGLKSVPRGHVVCFLKVLSQDDEEVTEISSTITFGCLSNGHVKENASPQESRRMAFMRQSLNSLRGILRGRMTPTTASWRESNLNQVLQQALTSGKIVMVTSIAAHSEAYDRTVNTLNFVKRLLITSTARSPYESSGNRKRSQASILEGSPEALVEQFGGQSTLVRELTSDPRQRLSKLIGRTSAKPRRLYGTSSTDEESEYQPTKYMTIDPGATSVVSEEPQPLDKTPPVSPSHSVQLESSDLFDDAWKASEEESPFVSEEAEGPEETPETQAVNKEPFVLQDPPQRGHTVDPPIEEEEENQVIEEELVDNEMNRFVDVDHSLVSTDGGAVKGKTKETKVRRLVHTNSSENLWESAAQGRARTRSRDLLFQEDATQSTDGDDKLLEEWLKETDEEEQKVAGAEVTTDYSNPISVVLSKDGNEIGGLEAPIDLRTSRTNDAGMDVAMESKDDFYRTVEDTIQNPVRARSTYVMKLQGAVEASDQQREEEIARVHSTPASARTQDETLEPEASQLTISIQQDAPATKYSSSRQEPPETTYNRVTSTSEFRQEISSIQGAVQEIQRVHSDLRLSSISLEKFQAFQESQQRQLDMAFSERQRAEDEAAELQKQLLRQAEDNSSIRHQYQQQIADLEKAILHDKAERSSIEKIAEEAIAAQDRAEGKLREAQKEASDLKEKASRVEVERDEIRRSFEQTGKDLSESRSKVNELMTENHLHSKRTEELSIEVTAHAAERDAMRASLNKAQAEIDALLAKLSKYALDTENTRKEVVVWKTSHDTLQAKLRNLEKTAMNEKQSLLSELDSERSRLEEALSLYKTRVENYEADIALSTRQANEREKEWSEKLSSEEERTKRLEAQLSSVTSARRELETQVADALEMKDAELKELQKLLENSEMESDEAKNKLMSFKRGILKYQKDAKEQVSKYVEEKKEVETRLREIELSHREHVKMLEQRLAEKDDESRAHGLLKQEMSTLKSHYSTAVSEKSLLRTKLDDSANEVRQLTSQVDSLQERLAAAKEADLKHHNLLKREIEALKIEYTREMSERSVLQSKLGEKDSEIHKLTFQVRKLEQEIAAKGEDSKAHDVMKREMQSLKLQFTSEMTDKRMLQSRLDDREVEIRQLRLELESMQKRVEEAQEQMSAASKSHMLLLERDDESRALGAHKIRRLERENEELRIALDSRPSINVVEYRSEHSRRVQLEELLASMASRAKNQLEIKNEEIYGLRMQLKAVCEEKEAEIRILRERIHDRDRRSIESSGSRRRSKSSVAESSFHWEI